MHNIVLIDNARNTWSAKFLIPFYKSYNAGQCDKVQLLTHSSTVNSNAQITIYRPICKKLETQDLEGPHMTCTLSGWISHEAGNQLTCTTFVMILDFAFRGRVPFCWDWSGFPCLVQLLPSYMCRITVNFGRLKDESLKIIISALNNCLCHRNLFQNGVNTFTKKLKTLYILYHLI